MAATDEVIRIKLFEHIKVYVKKDGKWSLTNSNDPLDTQINRFMIASGMLFHSMTPPSYHEIRPSEDDPTLKFIQACFCHFRLEEKSHEMEQQELPNFVPPV